MGKVLYRKYRSKSLPEILGQAPITTALENGVKTGRVSHAYLFTGPRGVGKTSTARILAHMVNDLPYDDDKSHIDIIEIDAASNRRIDEIRDLRDKVYITPSLAKYKVYIIDEVHMLTKEAFNALLKTLEEPPEHVIFILATTDVHKLPETIISRTQRYDFKPISEKDIVDHLKNIAKKEGFTIEDEALSMLAEKGDGSFRDSISLLDQISSSKNEITTDDVVTLLGIPSKKTISDLISDIDTNNISYQELSEKLFNLYDQGFNPGDLSKLLMSELRNRLITGQLNLSKDQTIALLDDLLEVNNSVDPKIKLQLILLSSINPGADQPIQKNEVAQPVKEDKKPEKKPNEVKELVIEEPTTKVSTEPVEDYWQATLDELKNKYNTLHGLVKNADVKIDDKEITITLDYPFHQKKVEDAKNKKILIDLVSKYKGSPVNITTNVENKKKNNLDKINQVFGDATPEDIE